MMACTPKLPSTTCVMPKSTPTDSNDVQRNEIFGSKAALEDLLGAEVPDFCYPCGLCDQRSRDLVEEAGYRTGLTCIRGAANTSHNPFDLTRKAISYGDNLIGFMWKVHMKHERKGRSRGWRPRQESNLYLTLRRGP
jgi:peptidoglycan/xylan/chitin deacetylase (PgdA/CDA1 family)